MGQQISGAIDGCTCVACFDKRQAFREQQEKVNTERLALCGRVCHSLSLEDLKEIAAGTVSLLTLHPKDPGETRRRAAEQFAACQAEYEDDYRI